MDVIKVFETNKKLECNTDWKLIQRILVSITSGKLPLGKTEKDGRHHIAIISTKIMEEENIPIHDMCELLAAYEHFLTILSGGEFSDPFNSMILTKLLHVMVNPVRRSERSY